MNTTEIAAKDVKALRDRTGAGMMDCKKALTEAQGDVEKAIERTPPSAHQISTISRVRVDGVVNIKIAIA